MVPEHDIDTDQQVKPKARPSIHTAILGWFSERPRGKVLDAEFSRVLRQNAPNRKQMLWWPMVACMRLFNCLRPAGRRRELRTDLTLEPKVILGGDNLIVIVRKGAGDSEVPTESTK